MIKNIFSKATKENLKIFFIYCFCASAFTLASYSLHKVCGIYATIPIVCITSSILIIVKYFIVDSMVKDFQKYLYDFIEEYPKKVGEIYRQEYINRQNGLLEELQNRLKENKEAK